MPVNFRSPAQLALNDPFAVVAVCSVTFHLKSVQVLGVGINVDDVQLPSSELLPDALGSVDELRCSNPAHPVATLAAMQTRRHHEPFVHNLYPAKAEPESQVPRDSYRAHEPHETGVGSQKYTTRFLQIQACFCR